jgi:heme exporter protein D
MQWGSWGEFWAMGGYWPYVWGSYGVTLVVMAIEIVSARQRQQRARAAVRRTRGTRQ